jgi:hypothetical protein
MRQGVVKTLSDNRFSSSEEKEEPAFLHFSDSL